MTGDFDLDLLAGAGSAALTGALGAGLSFPGDYRGEGWGLKKAVREF